jgi:hypothetical protein
MAVISVSVLQKTMDFPKGEHGSCSETCVMSTDGGIDVADIKIERISDMTEEEDEEPTTIAAIKTESKESCMSMVGFMHISYRPYPKLPSPLSACHCETKFFDCPKIGLKSFYEIVVSVCDALQVK